MLRARRLKLIAESNKPVFSSTDTEWWLAEAPAKNEAGSSNRPEKSVKAADLKKEVPPAPSASAQDAPVQEPAAVSASSTYEFLKEPAAAKSVSAYVAEEAEPETVTVTSFVKKEELTWNAKMSCFVMA